MEAITGQKELINKTAAFVKQALSNAEGGHDWWHTQRVWQNAKHLGAEEKVDMLVVELGALLHDIADSKFNDGDESIGPAKAVAFLEQLKAPPEVIEQVEKIVAHISFKGGNHFQEWTSPELKVLQDADRLDALGAIGIARAFSYGGFKGRVFYDPAIQPNMNMDKETYKSSTAPTLNHFYEKLLLLKDRMHTSTGKALAEERHRFMETFLEQFYKEWQGEK